MSDTIPCFAKHTKYQPTDAEWVCPGCEAKVGDFCIVEPIDAANPDCPLLHEDDLMGCMKCSEYEGETGKQFTKRITRKKNLVPCTCCKGTGFVTKKGK